MFKVYLYLLDTMADWEVGHIACELNSKRFFKKDAPEVVMKTVGISKEPVKTMGGLTVIPDCEVDEIEIGDKTVLLLPGADTWSRPEHTEIIQKADELLSCGGCVGAICGATLALANAGILDNRTHTSNGEGFLEMFSPVYKGKDYFVNDPAVSDGNLITAGPTAGLLWAKFIIEKLDVFKIETLNAWYCYFDTNNPECFYALMQSLNQD